jgi:two-component system, chemotaxis family, chemotaxis protein CheY
MANTNVKILTADDSAFMRKVLIDILNEGGYTTIIEAENGKDALDKFASESPDLVLLDIVMPEIDGMEALKQIGRKTKVIMISAVGQESIMNDAKSSGALGYIVKPFDKDKVIEEIKRVLG